tara:strand:- start:442 stop:648 length:207 start_codon:yes stop_codon:yes gene_type:complete
MKNATFGLRLNNSETIEDWSITLQVSESANWAQAGKLEIEHSDTILDAVMDAGHDLDEVTETPLLDLS